MLNQSKIEFESVTSLLSYLRNSKIKGKTTILGGHFLIDYETESNSLKPMIISESSNKYFQETTKIEAGTFPEESFQLSLDIIDNLDNKIEARILLLVNDHKFPTIWAKGVKKLIPKLRRKFYRDSRSIPSCYTQKILDKNLQPKSILIENKDLRRKENEVLPKSTFLFSEYIYRKKFDRTLKYKLLELDKFYSKKNSGGKKEIFFKSDDIEDYCIIQDGSCGCSGEIMQLIYDFVINFKTKNYILIIPNSCAVAVSAGIKSIIYFLEKSLNVNDINIKMIYGLDGDPDKFFIKKITLLEYGR